MKTGDLNLEQLQKLLEKHLFTADILALYIDQQIITPDQKNNSGGHDQLINEDGLKDILVGGTLTVDQVEKILTNEQTKSLISNLKASGLK